MEDNILNKIIESTYTLREVQRRVRILKKYLISKLFEKEGTLDDEVNSEMQWIASLDPGLYAHINQNNIYEVFEKLEKKLSEATPLVIYTAFEPSKEEITNIGIWLRNNTKNNPLFDLKLDKNLIGGCSLVNNGKYKDYSLKGKLEENITQISSIVRDSLAVKH